MRVGAPERNYNAIVSAQVFVPNSELQIARFSVNSSQDTLLKQIIQIAIECLQRPLVLYPYVRLLRESVRVHLESNYLHD